MPRIRTIKPEFWTSAQVLECSTNARLMFVGIWNFADDYGRHPYSAKQVKAEVFPADPFTEKEIIDLLGELETNRLISAYEADKTRYFYVTGWHHQRIDKPQSAKYPDPISDHSRNVRGAIPPDTILKERKDSSPNGKDEGFEIFYQAYPRHIAKAAAEKAFSKAIKKTDLATMLSALEKQKPKWTDPQYIPHPATWLNRGQWQDEVPVTVQPSFPTAR